MDVTYFGHSSFKLKGRQGSVVTDPYDPEMVGLKFAKIDADIVTVSHNHQDHDKVDLITNVKKVIDGPGEYEVLGISIIGLPSFHDDKKGEERGKNVIFVIEMDGIRLAHLGDLGHKLAENTLEAMGDIDVLMIPVGGGFTIGPVEAVEVTRQIEPSIVIPMHYRLPDMNPELAGKLASATDFVKELGSTSETLPKLSISKELINEEEQKLYILERR